MAAGTRIETRVGQRAGRMPSRLLGSLGSYPTFRRFWLAMLAGSIGQWMQQVALGWIALTMTNSPAFVGVVAFTAGVPFLIVSPIGGTLVDRLDRRRLMLTCQALAALLAVAVALAVIAGWAQPPHLLVAAALNGALQAILGPTQQSLTPSLVDRADLTNAIGLMGAGQNLTRIVGPSLAGVAIGLFGVGQAFLLQALAVGVAFALVLGIQLPERRIARAAGFEALAGIRLVFGRDDLRGLLLLSALPSLLIFPYLSFLNVFARDVLGIGAGGLGLLMAVSGAGALTGSLVVATSGRTAGMGRVLIGLSILYGGLIAAVFLSGSLPISLPLLFCSSCTASFFMSSTNALLQHRIDDAVRGRVMGVYMLTFGLMPLGALPMGLLAGVIGTPSAVAGGALLCSLVTAWLGLSSRALRAL